MTLNSFLSLSEVEQDEEIFDHGLFIKTFERNNYMYDIYRLHDFYVTIRYNLAKDDIGEISASATISFPDQVWEKSALKYEERYDKS